MTGQPPVFTSTYRYLPLQPRHIRLLECLWHDGNNSTPSFEYRIVHVKVPEEDPPPEFEAVSYTWGHPLKISVLPIQEDTGCIALTANLTQELPYISQHSSSKRLWIDQLCINQDDNAEKSVQVGMMSEIYSKASRVIVWLGTEDNSSTTCKEWLAALNGLLKVLPNADRMQVHTSNYHDAYRFLAIKKSFIDAQWDTKFITALTDFWSRVYFTRGWIVQEFLLARELIILIGNVHFSAQDLEDMYCVPPERENSQSYRQLIQLKRWQHNGAEPLGFFRKMTACAQKFQTREYGDTLYSMAGLLANLEFTPNYEQTVKENFTRFAAAVAQKFGSLDFLGLCAATIDSRIPDTPNEIREFPSWVPSWSSLPLSTPWRLVVGGTDAHMGEISWNAAVGRQHKQEQPLVYSTLSQLHVRGKIVDWIDVISPKTVIGARHFDADPAYLNNLVKQLKNDLPYCSTWTPTKLVHFLNGAAHNGNEIQSFNSATAILSPETRYSTGPPLNENGNNDGLALVLMIGRGRRIAMTENGKLALVPFIDSRAKSETGRGSPVAILYGCSVPLVLECVDEARQEYKVLGEAYVEEYMLGEAVTWTEDETEEFVLV
ncbi:hypothetical protein N0V94_000397 [Neodidymelliopsis sp. IMI 364377]|nr:hypothetical protein N0V94_000397 [Neodidymelliopsis sp. IMI 364377]